MRRWCHAPGHYSLEEIYEQVKQDLPSISLARVYKNLKTIRACRHAARSQSSLWLVAHRRQSPSPSPSGLHALPVHYRFGLRFAGPGETARQTSFGFQTGKVQLRCRASARLARQQRNQAALDCYCKLPPSGETSSTDPPICDDPARKGHSSVAMTVTCHKRL